MSIAGSVRSGEAARYTPPQPGDRPPSDAVPPRRRPRLFRWKGIIPLALGFALAALGWLLFGERLVRDTVEEGATKALGAEVDIAQLMIDELETTVELRGVAVANPFDPRRNLIEAKVLHVELEPEPLLERKLVVRRLTIGDVRTGTMRATPARPVAGGGFASSALRELERWSRQFDVPVLSLTPIDTIKSIVLDPMQLKSVQAALALGRHADSVRGALEQGYAGLKLQETLDSAQALVANLQRTNLRTLGIAGARTAIADVRRATARIDSTKRRVEALAALARGSLDTLQGALRSIDDARKADYTFARGLLKLPSFDAPDMGAALFGKVTIDKFQQALYWTELARKYAPPGLVPRESQGPKRLRRAGSTVHFVAAKAYPRFLLRRADVDVTVADGPARGKYVMAIADATTEPALVGRPMVFALRRTATQTGVDSLHVTGVVDHTRDRPRDVITVAAAGLKLPVITLPVLPYRADPGAGSSEMRLSLDGDRLAARWMVSSDHLSWTPDGGRMRQLNAVEALVARVLLGVGQLNLVAELDGPVRSPKLAVRSNLDRVVADRLRAVVGEEVARAEAKVRSRVDSLVAEKSAPVKTRIAELRTASDQRIAEARARLDAEKQKLDAQLKALSGGLVKLP